MKNLSLFTLCLTLLLASCGLSGNANDEEAKPIENELSQPQSENYSKKLVMTPMRNSQTGELLGHIPIPKDWRIENNTLKGPNGIETMDYANKFFSFEQRMVIPLEQVLREDIAPVIYQSGGKILGTFEIPEIANYDRGYSGLLWKFGNPREEFHALGVDVVDPDGKRGLLIFRQMISRSAYGSSWGYYINALNCKPEDYEEAKSDYIFALSHVHPNMEAIQRYNQNEIAKSNASWAAHSARMQANQAAFNARNQAWMDASNSISDMSMKGWRARNQMNDAGHDATINSINEEKTIYNDASGEYMQVEAGSNRYFTNGNNEYIRTDDYLYNPNLDQSVNHYEWKEWKDN
jgi:hypothetical protein